MPQAIHGRVAVVAVDVADVVVGVVLLKRFNTPKHQKKCCFRSFARPPRRRGRKKRQRAQ